MPSNSEELEIGGSTDGAAPGPLTRTASWANMSRMRVSALGNRVRLGGLLRWVQSWRHDIVGNPDLAFVWFRGRGSNFFQAVLLDLPEPLLLMKPAGPPS